MNHIKNSLVAFVGLLLIVIAVTAIIPALTRGQKSDAFRTPPTLDVNVVNTSSEPVPVTGTINVGNPGENPLPVRDVDNTARLPVHFNESYTVPNGKRLVVEYVSMGIGSQTKCDVIAVDLSSESTVLHTYYPAFVGVFFGPTSRPYRYGLSQETRAYVGQNRTVSFGFGGHSGCGAGPDFSHVGASGYLVDM